MARWAKEHTAFVGPATSPEEVWGMRGGEWRVEGHPDGMWTNISIIFPFERDYFLARPQNPSSEGNQQSTSSPAGVALPTPAEFRSHQQGSTIARSSPC